MAQVRLSVELCTTYWHYLLLVWLVLFGLLFSGNDRSRYLVVNLWFKVNGEKLTSEHKLR